MSTIKVFSDSTCDLGAELIKKHDIGIVPLHVIFGEDAYDDGFNIDTARLYSLVDETGQLPKTAAPSPGEFAGAFEPFIKQGQSILYISLSSEMSATYQNALIAAEQFEPGSVRVVDSRNVSTGIGLLVLKACDLVAEGRSIDEAEETIRGMTGKIDVEFVIDTLEYLHKGGRLSAVQHFIGSLLKIRPLVKVVDGKMIVADKIRGSRDKAVAKLLENGLDNVRTFDRSRAFVTHSMAREEAAELISRLEQAGAGNVLLTETGCVISSHCGPHTIGIVYLKQ